MFVVLLTQLLNVEAQDGFAFAILQPSVVFAWQKSVGGGLNFDPRFSLTQAWNTIPLPKASGHSRARIIS